MHHGVIGACAAEVRNKIYQYAIDIDDKKWFLGMPKSRKWMLYAQQLDPFGLHNWLGFNLTRATGQYAARTQFCEVRLSLHVLIICIPLAQLRYAALIMGLAEYTKTTGCHAIG